MNNLNEQIVAFAIGVVSSIIASVVYTWTAARIEAHFSFRRIVELVLDLAGRIQNDGFKPDFIFAIDRNSTITGGILAGHLGLQTILSVATDNFRKSDGSRAIAISDGFAPKGEAFVGKKILIFICFNDSGTSLETVYNYTKAMSEAPADVRTAALFTSSSPRFMPTYFVKKVGLNLRTPINALMPKMPWVSKTWKHVLGNERLASK